MFWYAAPEHQSHIHSSNLYSTGSALENVSPLPLRAAHECAAVQLEQNLDTHVIFFNLSFIPLCGLLARFSVSDLVRWLIMCEPNDVQCGYNSISHPVHLPGSPLTRPIKVKKSPFLSAFNDVTMTSGCPPPARLGGGRGWRHQHRHSSERMQKLPGIS